MTKGRQCKKNTLGWLLRAIKSGLIYDGTKAQPQQEMFLPPPQRALMQGYFVLFGNVLLFTGLLKASSPPPPGQAGIPQASPFFASPNTAEFSYFALYRRAGCLGGSR